MVRSITRIESELERYHHKVDRILEGIMLEHKWRRAMEMKDGNGESVQENFLDVLFNFQGQDGLGVHLIGTSIKAIIFVSNLTKRFFFMSTYHL